MKSGLEQRLIFSECWFKFAFISKPKGHLFAHIQTILGIAYDAQWDRFPPMNTARFMDVF